VHIVGGVAPVLPGSLEDMPWQHRLRRRWSPLRTGTQPPGIAARLARELAAARPAGELPAPLSSTRLVRWLDDNSLRHFVDDEGDVGRVWGGRLFYFFLFGHHQEILQVRGHWQREAAIERLGEILEFCNQWNTDRVWPKAYVRVSDLGRVHVVAEVAIDFEHGATDDQLGQTLRCGLSTGSMLFDALDEQYPDPVGLAP
jgi:hypothetical protein